MRAELVLITAPDEPVISLEEAKAHIPVEHDDDDELINSLIHAGIGELDGRNGWLGRALVTQTWELRVDYGFPCRFKVPLPPMQSVTSITYVDTAGDTQTLATDQYDVFKDQEPALIEPAYGVAWPTTRCQREAVKVRFVAGYGAAAAVPEIIKSRIKVFVGTAYEHREEMVTGTIVADIPFLKYGLESYRVPFDWTKQ